MEHHHQPHMYHAAIADWVPMLLAVVLGLLYMSGLVRLSAKKGTWDSWRTLSFLIGTAMLAVAAYPPMMHWAHHNMKGHMVQHLLIGMFGPTFLVLGAPVTLALKVLSASTSRKITFVLKSSVFRFVSHPLTALLLNIGGMYILYLTPLYVESISNPFLHYCIHIHFLVAGYLFSWAIIGSDPVPRRPGFGIRLVVMFIGIAAHAFLGKYMYAYLYPLNSPHSDQQIREASKLMYYWGDLSELILLIVLFSIWYRERGRARYDAFLSVSRR